VGESVCGWTAMAIVVDGRPNPLSCNVNNGKALLRQQEICLRLLNSHDGPGCISSGPPLIVITLGRRIPVNCSFTAKWIRGYGKTRIWSSVDKYRTVRRLIEIDLRGNSKVTFGTYACTKFGHSL